MINTVEALIKDHEGYNGRTYTDTTGNQTIAWGHKLTEGEAYPDGILVGDAQHWFDIDLRKATQAASSVVTSFAALNDVRQAVLIDMAYNLGAKGLASFHQMIAYIDVMDFVGAGECMKQSLWHRQVGQRALDDIQLMVSGEWS